MFNWTRSHYTVRCCNHSSYIVYSGYSKSDYDYYRNRSNYCSYCSAEETNRENERRARERALKQQRLEAERLELEQKRLRELKQKELKEKREAEQKALIKKRQDEENARVAKVEAMKAKLKKEFDAEEKKMEDVKRKAEKAEKDQQENVYNKWMKLDTLTIVKDIGNRVKLCSAAGQDVVNSVKNIEDQLKNSLKDQYKTVEDEINKYKKYGTEMKDMDKVFIDEFSKVLNCDFINQTKAAITNINDNIKNETDSKQEQNDILNSEQSMESKMKQFQELLNKHNEKKGEFVGGIKTALNLLDNAICNMENKLFIIGEYYNDMIKDHENFINFCKNQGDQYGDEMKEIKQYLDKIGADIKDKKRDLYEGQSEDVERKTFSADYTHITVHKIENKNDEDEDSEFSDYANEGAMIGLVGGAVIGGIAGGIVGFVPGCIAGAIIGGSLGMAAGGIIGGMFEKKKYEKETKTTTTKSTKTITLQNDIYDGNKQHNALQEIISALKPQFIEYQQKLLTAKNNAEDQKNDAVDFRKDLKKIEKQIRGFKNTLTGFKDELKKSKINDTFRDNLKKKCLGLFGEIQKMMLDLESASKNKKQWTEKNH